MEISKLSSWRKCRCQNQKTRVCSFVSLTAKGNCAKTLPHIVRWSTKSFISKFCNIWDSESIVRPELFPNKWILHCDSVPSHKVLSIMQFLAPKKIMVLEYHAYSLDLILCWLLPIPYHEESSQGIRFWNHGGNSEGCDGCSVTSESALTIWNSADIHKKLHEKTTWKKTSTVQNKINTVLRVSNSLYLSDLVLLYFLDMCF
jgi:hypothetical protein